MKPYMKQKTNHRMGKMFANDATDKGLISKIYDQLTELNIKKNQKQTKKDPIKKWTEDLKRYSLKKTYRC